MENILGGSSSKGMFRKQKLAPLNVFHQKKSDFTVADSMPPVIKSNSNAASTFSKSLKPLDNINSVNLSDSLSSDETVSCDYEPPLLSTKDDRYRLPLTVVVSPTDSISTDSGIGTPCISSASTSAGSTCSRRRPAQVPLTNTSDEDSSGPEDEDPFSSAETGSSASEYIVVRPTGFKEHAREIYKPSKRLKEKRALVFYSSGNTQSTTLPSVSVPMHARGLPNSMWKEPNKPLYSPVQTLPRLTLAKHTDDLSDSTICPSNNNHQSQASVMKHRIWINNNEDEEASLRKLFEVVKLNHGKSYEILEPIKRNPPPALNKKKFLRGHDPCLTDSNRFPYLQKKVPSTENTCCSFSLPIVD